MDIHLQVMLVALALATSGTQEVLLEQPYNVLPFVEDGLRALVVNNETEPKMTAINKSEV